MTVAKPQMQRCACGTEWFQVHICPLVGKSKPATSRMEGVPELKKRLLEMAALVSELQEDKANLQDTVTSLMLEIAELRSVLEIKQEQAREVHP